MEMPDVLKKGVWKFDIMYWLKLSNYSNSLMDPSTAVQTKPQTHFSEEIHKHIPL